MIDAAGDASLDLSQDALLADTTPMTGEAGTLLANGAPCTLGTACTSGLCVDGVCCESACAGQCEACAENGSQGRCVAVAGVPRGVRGACGGQGTPCAGSCSGTNGAACSYPGMEKECAAASCQGGVALTRSVCDGQGACPTQTMVSCAPLGCAGAICAGGCSAQNPAPPTATATRASARPASRWARCAPPPRSAPGTAASTASAATPLRRRLPGCGGANAGHCGAVKSADDDHCLGGKTCDAAGACKDRAGSGCTAGADCATGNCVDGKCCGSASCGACQACTGGGGACVAVISKDDPDSCAGTCDGSGTCKGKKGQSCPAAGCATGTCADGVCCDQACSGTCMACDLPGTVGTCSVVASGNPHGARGTCGSGTCAGTCAGRLDGQCQFPTGACGTSDCSGGQLMAQGTCMNGACMMPPPQSCQAGCTGSTCLTISKLTSHGASNCALLSDGSVRCWGSDGDGQLGNGEPKTNSAAPVTVGLGGSAIALASAPNQHCAILPGGAVKCWGFNGTGQLGNGDTIASSTAVSVTIPGATPATQVAAAFYTTCTVVGSGVKCWGDNTMNEFGDSSLDTLNPTTLVAGYDHYCALLSGGTVKCWGNNSRGQLGKDPATATTSATAVQVTDLSGATALSLGTFFSCAIVSGGAVECWGKNTDGQLGDGTATTAGPNSFRPVTVKNLSGPAVAIASGYNHTCVVISGGAVNCWGKNDKGQLGNGASGGISGVAQPVAGLSGATALAGGIAHTCAVVSNGVKCWGDNGALQLGVTSPSDMSTSPVTVTGW
jgi:alpha-tubulin suppressor-like RCC1 family protein